jgi:hypothetical protein
MGWNGSYEELRDYLWRFAIAGALRVMARGPAHVTQQWQRASVDDRRAQPSGVEQRTDSPGREDC